MNIVLQSVYDIKEEAHLHQLSSSTQFPTCFEWLMKCHTPPLFMIC